MARVVPPLSLLPLTDPEYRDFAERQVAESARQRVEAGEWTLMDAHKRARVEQAEAPHSDLLTRLSPGQPVVAWLTAGGANQLPATPI